MDDIILNEVESFTWSEGTTLKGQQVEFSCASNKVEEAKEALKLFRHIRIPHTNELKTNHGCCCRYSRYNIKQHKYAGGNGYIEVLEIINSPDGRCGFIVNSYENLLGSFFAEFETIDTAIEAYEVFWRMSGGYYVDSIKKVIGFKRLVFYHCLTPWFYAVGDQQISGDFVIPQYIHEDSFFHFGKQYIVRDYQGLPQLKTCWGLHYEKLYDHKIDDFGRRELVPHRVVQWSDGTIWRESKSSNLPEVLTEDKMWIQEAVDKFRQFLSGEISKFEIAFANGTKFVGSLKKSRDKKYLEGRYKVNLTLDNEKTIEGEFDFIPTKKASTVEVFLHNEVRSKNRKIKKINSLIKISDRKNEKWIGVY